jgi:hypothetical protein
MTCGLLSAQSDFIMDPDHINTTHLARLIHLSFDSIRKKEGNGPLRIHSQLQMLSQESAAVLIDKNTGTSHNFTLTKRLEGLSIDLETTGSLEAVSELEEPINYFAPIRNYTYRNQTYGQTAQNLVKKMSVSADFKRLLADARISQLGIGIAYETVSHQLAVVCYYAAGQSDETTIRQELPQAQSVKIISDTPTQWFKLSKRSNRNLKLAQKWTGRASGYHGWVTVSKKNLRRAFRWYHFRSGLVSETRTAEQFSNDISYLGQPSRNNQRAITNGTISGLIKRSSLIKSWKEQANPSQLKILGIKTPIKKWPRYSSFKIPTSEFDQSSSQLLVIRKAKLCNIFSINPIPSKELNPSFPPLPFLLPRASSPIQKIISAQADSSAYQVYYQRGVTQLKEEDKQGLLEMVEEGTQISKIIIHAFASIEGNLASNEKLFKERALTIQTFLESEGVTSGNVELILHTEENWKDMRQQFQMDSALSKLSDQPESEIRNYINSQKEDSQVTEWLNAQRFAWVNFELIRQVEKEETSQEILQQFNTLLIQPKPTIQTVKKLATLQKKYYNLLVFRNEPLANVLTFPSDNRFGPLRYQQAVFRYQHQSETDENFYSEIKAIHEIPGINPLLKKNCVEHHQTHLANEIYYRNSITPKYEEWSCPAEKNKSIYLIEPKIHHHDFNGFSVWIDVLDLVQKVSQTYQLHKEQRQIARQLDLYYLVNRSQLLLRENKFSYLPEVQKLAKDVWQRHVTGSQLSEPEIIEYALYFNLTHQPSYAFQLLRPLVERTRPNPYALMIWISMHTMQWGELKTEQEVLRAQEFLSKEEWSELVDSGSYLPLTLMERYKIRHAWYSSQEQ